MIHIYDIPVVFFIEIEDEYLVPSLEERERIKNTLIIELGYAIGEFDFIHDAISERINGTVNSIKLQKINKNEHS